jgi:hypothetical protein
MRVASSAIVLLSLGCNAAGAQTPSGARKRPVTTTTASATASVAPASPWRIDRADVAVPSAVGLAFRIVSVRSTAKRADHALLVVDEARRSLSRLIDVGGVMAPIKTHDGRHVVAAFGPPIDRLVTSNQSSLFVEPLTVDAPPLEHALRADAVVALAGRTLAFIEEREEPREPPPDPIPKTRKRRPPRPAVPKMTPVRLWLHPVDPHKSTLGDAVDTGIAFARPMPGMGLAAAEGTAKGARLLWFAPTVPEQRELRWVARAQLATGSLDEHGAHLPGDATVYAGPKAFGFIEGHARPRLFARGDEAIYVGRVERNVGRKLTSEWEARLLHGSRAITATDSAWVVDPWRPLQGSPIAPEEESALARIAGESPELAEKQSPHEPGRVAWIGERGLYTSGQRLFAADASDGAAKELPHPFQAKRAALHWGFFDTDGTGLGCTDEGLVSIAEDGGATKHALSSASLREEPSSLARVAGSWWGVFPAPVDDSGRSSGGRVVRVMDGVEGALSAHAYLGSAALVGGREHGTFLSLRGQRMTVWRIAPDGTASELAHHRAAVRPGFIAVRRASGGALVIGIEPLPGARAIALAVDDAGSVSDPSALPIDLAPGMIAAMPLPRGGAIVWAKPDSRDPAAHPKTVVWIADDGRVEAHAAWSSSRGAASCGSGTPIPRSMPAIAPATFVSIDLSDACAHAMPTWTRDGLRWMGSRSTGIDATAERVIARIEQGDTAATPSAAIIPARREEAVPASPCPADMVSVGGTLCVDRFESQLVDAGGVALSPNYSTTPHVVKLVLDEWSFGRFVTGDLHARAMPLPPLLRAIDAAPKPVAVSRPGVVPSGYVSGVTADAACRAAGKRLCTLAEWTKACRGEDDRDFPYGASYDQGACNVYRFAHPAATLHGNAAIGHLDPRLNLVQDGGEPMLRRTGATPRCVSRWGNDGIYDMVGNLDEWIDKDSGAFAGGFYARSVKKGCEAVIGVHPRRYFDYSLGVRCCSTPS